MLPFLKNDKPQVGGISNVITRPSDNPEENQDDSGLHACASDLIDAVHSKDIPGAAAAMRAAFELLEQEPHDEADEHDMGEME